MHLSRLDNEVFFKKAFTNKLVFTQFVKDVIGIDIQVGKIETEKRFKPKIAYIDFAYDIFAESKDNRVIIEIQRVNYDYSFDRFLHYHSVHPETALKIPKLKLWTPNNGHLGVQSFSFGSVSGWTLS
jgi:hypothetical protein